MSSRVSRPLGLLLIFNLQKHNTWYVTNDCQFMKYFIMLVHLLQTSFNLLLPGSFFFLLSVPQDLQ